MMRLGHAEARRHRESMEDRIALGSVPGALVVAVFDGHGGVEVAEHAAHEAVIQVEKAIEIGLAGKALWRRVFERLDLDRPYCGSTATLLLLRERSVTAAWAGDSRAILVSEAEQVVLTPDHRIDRTDERRRVVAAGAALDPPYAVDPLTGRGLMVTRTLGDRALRRIGIVAEPEVSEVDLRHDDLGFVLATDGLWDVVTEAEAASACRQAEAQEAADRLLNLVIRRDGPDNVTVIVGRF